LTVAALFVQKNGVYYGLDGVDPWDEARDARKYSGPWPVVAHPPCSRWCKPLAFVNQTRYGHKVGDDGGCFESALRSVRAWGGVLEHPAETVAWERFDLPAPPREGWGRGLCGGWTCTVSQRAYGHLARKQTWLYAYRTGLPPLDWSRPQPVAQVSWLKRGSRDLPRITGKAASATPIPFRDLLLSIARSAVKGAHAA
jgi:hypothetical protein